MVRKLRASTRNLKSQDVKQAATSGSKLTPTSGRRLTNFKVLSGATKRCPLPESRKKRPSLKRKLRRKEEQPEVSSISSSSSTRTTTTTSVIAVISTSTTTSTSSSTSSQQLSITYQQTGSGSKTGSEPEALQNIVDSIERVVTSSTGVDLTSIQNNRSIHLRNRSVRMSEPLPVPPLTSALLPKKHSHNSNQFLDCRLAGSVAGSVAGKVAGRVSGSVAEASQTAATGRIERNGQSSVSLRKRRAEEPESWRIDHGWGVQRGRSQTGAGGVA